MNDEYLEQNDAADHYLEEFNVTRLESMVDWVDGFTNLETFTISCVPVPRLAGKLDWQKIRVYSREKWGSRCPSLKRIDLFGIDV